MPTSLFNRFAAARHGAVFAACALAACSSLAPPTRPVAPMSATGRPAASVVAPAPGSLPAPSWGASASAAVTVESPALAARFPDPSVTYATPAFEPGHVGYTRNAELRVALHRLADDMAARTDGATVVRLLQVGSSQTGVPLEAVHISRTPMGDVSSRLARPTVLLVGQQHGDEPAGSEALLVIAQSLVDGPLAAVLERIDVVMLPRANPDGAAAERRTTASGIDPNRDHLLLRTPEAQAQAQLAREFNPVVVVDLHEFSAAGRLFEKFGAVQRFDAMLQYAMTANLPEFLTKASEEWFRRPMLTRFDAEGLSHEWYHTTSSDLADKKVSMGGVQPDTGRNINGLRNAVSLLVETRGGGIGRAHLSRRVHTHVVAVTSVLQSAAAHADDLLKLRRFVDADVSVKACQGEVIVEAAATPSEYNLRMLDPQTGADRTLNVAWDSALELHAVKRRTRPCGYWLGADQFDAVMRLRGLGVQVQRIEEGAELRGETYAETGRETAPRGDVRGGIVDLAGALIVKVDLVPGLIDMPAGSYYVGLDQPLANLVVAAIEPDTKNSFVANRIVINLRSQARVMARPELQMMPVP